VLARPSDAFKCRPTITLGIEARREREREREREGGGEGERERERESEHERIDSRQKIERVDTIYTRACSTSRPFRGGLSRRAATNASSLSKIDKARPAIFIARKMTTAKLTTTFRRPRGTPPRSNFEKGVLISSHPSVAYMHYNYAWLNLGLGSPSRTLQRSGPVSRTSYA